MTRIHPIGLLLLVASTCAFAELRPSEVTILIRAEMRQHPDWTRQAQAGPHVARLTTSNLDRHERFALGEVHFLNFKPEESRDAFWEFRDDDTLLGRVAWQRLMQIRFAAFGMREEVEADLKQYRERFPLDPADRFDLLQTVANLAGHYLSEGEPQRAVSLIDAELERLDLRAPYWAYVLPLRFMEAYEAVGRRDEIVGTVRTVIADLRRVAEQRRRSPPAIDSLSRSIVFGAGPQPVPGEYFFAAIGDDADYHEQTARFDRMADYLEQQLEQGADQR